MQPMRTQPPMSPGPRPSRPFRFGLMIDSRDGSRERVIELARRAEASGIDVLLGTDHLGRWATVPLLQAAAETSGIRIGTFVLNNDLRHPAVLAQELATVDAITGGRLEIGLGAGWRREEYDAAGLTYDPPPERVDRLEASVRMLKQAMSEGRIEHRADAAYPAVLLEGMPMSTQRPHPPILVGGGGSRLLRFAAREADIVALNPRSLPEGTLDPTDVTATAIDAKIGWIRGAAGDRWNRLEINIVLLDVDPDFDRRNGPPPARTHGISEADFPNSPHYLAGDEARMVEALQARRERWAISYVAMRPEHLDVMGGVVARLSGT